MCEGGYPDFYEQKLLKTRAPHRCVECKETIPKYTQMFRVKCLSDGCWDTHYTCLDCEAIRQYIFNAYPNVDLCHYELNEWLLYECFDNRWDISATAKEEQIPSEIDGRGVIQGRYCTFLPKVEWLSPRIDGKFKLAEGINKDELLNKNASVKSETPSQKLVTDAQFISKIKG